MGSPISSNGAASWRSSARPTRPLDLPGRLAAVGLRVQDVASAPDGVVRLICRREDA